MLKHLASKNNTQERTTSSLEPSVVFLRIKEARVPEFQIMIILMIMKMILTSSSSSIRENPRHHHRHLKRPMFTLKDNRKF
tara:strand:+ start:476 stop:718 length:243 start_codon:yes stop_codon:yes gene_type:complete